MQKQTSNAFVCDCSRSLMNDPFAIDGTREIAVSTTTTDQSTTSNVKQ
jgi:hypothetical protein